MMGHWRQRLGHAVGLRLAVWYAAVFLLTSAAVGLLTYRLLVTSLERRDHDLLLVKLEEYAVNYQQGGLESVEQAVSAERVSGSADTVMVRLIGGGEEVRYFSLPTAWRTYDLGRLRVASPFAGDDWREVKSNVDTTTLEVVSRPLWDGTIVQVGRTTVEREQFLAQVRDLMGIVMVCVVVAGLAGGVALTRSALRPLRELRDTVRTIAATGRLDARVTAEGDGDLVDELGVVFNAMFARIEALVGGMREALDNVAHDLRTPVARLRARAESALASAADPAAAREALAICVEEADRVTALLTTLMDISEAEAGTMKLSLSAVPVDDILRDTIDLYEDTAEERGVTLTATPAPGLTVRADRQRVRQVFANLVDNALKFTESGGSVTLHAEARPDGDVDVVVRDTGRGIPAQDLPRIWDRLYRGDVTHEHSLGLGLSLVRAIVAAHGGTAEVESEIGRGSTFRITLKAPLRT
jgi:signal transduction histidine kinase